MTLLSLLEQLYDMPQRVSYSQFVKVRQDIRNHPDYYTIKDEFEQTYTKETGWVFVGADSSSLEDRIITLLTKDTNRLKVYTDGYDGHCLRAYTYFKEYMPDTQQANNERCYMVDGISFKESDIINYQGTKYTGQQFYDLFN